MDIMINGPSDTEILEAIRVSSLRDSVSEPGSEPAIEASRALVSKWLSKRRIYEAAKKRWTRIDGGYRLLLATAAHQYSITVRPEYVGCTATTRTARPGETHLRGNDLPDGPLSEATIDEIMSAIVAYELVEIPVERPFGGNFDFVGFVGEAKALAKTVA